MMPSLALMDAPPPLHLRAFRVLHTLNLLLIAMLTPVTTDSAIALEAVR